MEPEKKEQIKISGLAGLNDAIIDLGRFNLFIGPQASGKSVAAKVLYFLKSFCDTAIESIAGGLTYEVFLEERIRQFDRYFPPAFRSANGFRVEYVLNRNGIIIDGGKNVAVVIDSPAWKHLYNEVAEQCNRAQNGLLRNSLTPKLAMSIRYQVVFGVPMPTPQIFIPDGRSDYLRFVEKVTLIQQSQYVQDLIDPFMADFLSVYTWARDSLGKALSDWTEVFDLDSITSIFRGRPVEKDGETHILMDDGRLVPLSFASSGQKEMIPVFKMLAFLLVTAKSSTGHQVFPLYIEEPETHLFPESQVKASEEITKKFNQVLLSQIVVTTHSPYVATALNNLLYAGQLGKSSSGREYVKEIMPEPYWLNSEEFSAFRFDGGCVQDAIDPETGLIQADIIDSASNEIGGVFDRLLELDDRE